MPSEPDLKQTALTADKVKLTGRNQLEKAAQVYSDISFYQKHMMCTVVLDSTAKWHSKQSTEMRSVPESLDYEIRIRRDM
eukprot:8877204-Karenia_brevis.AAC.1